MKQEKSCGAVIYSLIDNQRYYLIEKMVKGHYAMCKGHVEANETEILTTLREIKEETNLEVKLDSSFRKTLSYSPAYGINKEVVYFVAYAPNIETIPQKEEVDEIYFLPYDAAYNLLTFDNDKEVLKAAEDYLKAR